MRQLRIHIGDKIFIANLRYTHTTNMIWQNLPFEGKVNLWGEEIYCHIPIEADLESDARDTLEPGELAFWPTGSAFCIFFGPTPASTDDRPKAYSAVNILGKIEGELTDLFHITENETIKICLEN